MDLCLNLSVVEVSEMIARMPPGNTVLDCGCFGWRLATACAAYRQHLVGLDRVEPPGRPLEAGFARMEGEGPVGPQIDLPDDTGHFTVASHVIEHISNPVAFFAAIVRVTAPGGLLWLEAPSELSLLSCSSDDPTDHRFFSFFDDPTHVRCHTPGSLYRLAIATQCQPLEIGRGQAGDIPVVRM